MASLTTAASTPQGQALQAPPKTGFLLLIPRFWACTIVNRASTKNSAAITMERRCPLCWVMQLVLNFQWTGAIADFFGRHSALVQDAHQQIRHRCVERIGQVPPSLKLPPSASGHQAREIRVAVQV